MGFLSFLSKSGRIFFLSLLFINLQAQQEVLIAEAEAEEGLLTGVNIASSGSGYSGSGYVTGFTNEGDKVTVTVNIPEEGLYTLKIRYRGTSGDKYQYVSVNEGFASQVSFPASSDFVVIPAGSYELQQGDNSFTVEKSWGWTDIDKFLVYSYSPGNFQISPSPVDPDAGTEVRFPLYIFAQAVREKDYFRPDS